MVVFSYRFLNICANSSRSLASKMSVASRLTTQLNQQINGLAISRLFKRVKSGLVEIYNNARIAQLVEHSTDTRAVPSSNLGSRTAIIKAP